MPFSELQKEGETKKAFKNSFLDYKNISICSKISGGIPGGSPRIDNTHGFTHGGSSYDMVASQRDTIFSNVSSLTFEVFSKVASWRIFSTDEPSDNLLYYSGFRHGLSAIHCPLMAPLLKTTMCSFVFSKKITHQESWDEAEDADTDATSEYSDYDNLLLNSRTTTSYNDNTINSMNSCVSRPSVTKYCNEELIDCFDTPTYHSMCSLKSSQNIIDAQSSPLQFITTQVEVSKMARHLSHHLDVRNILSLPTTTYQSSVIVSNMESGLNRMLFDDGWSWIAVSNDPNIESSPISLLGASDVDEGDKFLETERCVICLERFQDGDKLRILPCRHRFHMGCVDRWLYQTLSDRLFGTNGCPMCKDCTINSTETFVPDGSVPAWAFAQIGGALAEKCRKQKVTSRVID